MPFCSECGLTVNEIPLYRNNPKGEKADWRCESHLNKKPPKDVKEIVNVIDGR